VYLNSISIHVVEIIMLTSLKANTIYATYKRS